MFLKKNPHFFSQLKIYSDLSNYLTRRFNNLTRNKVKHINLSRLIEIYEFLIKHVLFFLYFKVKIHEIIT